MTSKTPIATDDAPAKPSGRFVNSLTESFGLSRPAALAAFTLICVVLAFTVFWFFYSAPPKVLIITSGLPGSMFESNAVKYQKLLTNENVSLVIWPSKGSEENLQRLNDPSHKKVKIGFVQGGNTNGLGADGLPTNHLVSLGNLFFEPLFVFYRGDRPLTLLSELKGKRLAIGPLGSGTRSLAMTLLELNGINATNGAAQFFDLDGEEAAKGLTNGTVDAAFLMGDSASPQVLRRLLGSTEIHAMDFIQADAYTRRIPYLNKLTLPMGSFDFGKNLPAQDLHLIGPTVELIARKDLHPALSDLLIEAAMKVNGTPGLLRRKGEFPNALEHDFPISADAARFYKSGKSFFYKWSLPFWMASLLNRIVVAFVPIVVVLIPGLRVIPAFFKWRVHQQINRRYRSLLLLEREVESANSAKNHVELETRLDQIEDSVNRMKLPASFSEQFYNLRGHVSFVRGQLMQKVAGQN